MDILVACPRPARGPERNPNTRWIMGFYDNRRSLKMRRRRAEDKKKERGKKAAEARRQERRARPKA